MTKSVNEMTDEEWNIYQEEWLEKNHTHYCKLYTCNDCGAICETHGYKTHKEAEQDSIEKYICLNCGSTNINSNNIVQKFRNAVCLSRGGPAVGMYEAF